MNIPDDAIKTAVGALIDAGWLSSQAATEFAETVIEAAMPAIREAIAQEIEASKATQRVATDHEPRWSAGACKCGAPLGDGIDLHWHMVNQTIDHAARIVRGGTP